MTDIGTTGQRATTGQSGATGQSPTGSDTERLGAEPDADAAPRHLPVMASEALAILAGERPLASRLIVDATLGMGGHAELLLEQGARVLGLDRDAESITLARQRLGRFLPDGRLRTCQADYRDLPRVLAEAGTGPVDGILADLGISSHQLDTAERGFSFGADGPLDMRMDRSGDLPTAAELLARLSERELMLLLFERGEEPDARRIARAIMRAQAEQPIRTTAALAAIVTSAKRRPRPGERERLHPATLTFQALRIAVNGEITGLQRFVEDAVAALRPGARLVVISFHSLEDREVKTALRALEKGCTCPPDFPICNCGRGPVVRLLPRRALRPSPEECARNPRARSARLRAAERMAA